MVDPLTLAVVQGALQELTSEMDVAFASAAFSPIISEGKDLASGVYHPVTGEVIAQGETSLPLFVTVMQHTVQAVLKAIEGRRAFEPGDLYVVNNPFQGGTHLMDVKMVMPCFVDGRLFAILANSGHWPDVGGSVPGGFNGRATEIHQEGLIMPPVRLYRAGQLDHELLDLILKNCRASRPRIGDIYAQAGALHVGADRLGALVSRIGTEVVEACMEEIFERSETIMRSYIEELPDGVYEYVDYMDSDGIDPDPVPIKLRMSVSGSDMTLDFSESAPPCKGPLNSVYCSTVSACHIALKHIFADVPVNAGAFRPVRVIAPKTTFLNASWPQPVSGATAEVTQRIIDVVFGALAQMVPGQITAGSFSTTFNVTIGGTDEEIGEYVVYLYFGGGYGAHSDGDGISNGCSLHSTARMTPMEVYEQGFPFRIVYFRQRENSGGRGRQRGGFGVELAIQLLRGTALVSVVGERGRFPPRGLFGGEDAACSHFAIRRTNGEIYRPVLLTKDERIPIREGDIVEVGTPGGAGYGPPEERAPEDLKADQLAGYYTQA